MNQDNITGEGNINADSQEALRLENDILKLKMQAEYGAIFGSFKEVSAEAEHDFLKMVMAFEEMEQTASAVSLFEFLGKPVTRVIAEIPAWELPGALEQLLELLSTNGISLECGSETDPAVLYRFITEELFLEQIRDIRMPGMVCVFNYEDFHPNHKLELEQATADFFSRWKNNQLENLFHELAEFGVLPNGTMLTREQLLGKMKEQRSRIQNIDQLDFDISHCSFEWMQEGLGLGFTEGEIKMQAGSKFGPCTTHGPFKFYFCNQGPGWQLTFFYLPGFQWV